MQDTNNKNNDHNSNLKPVLETQVHIQQGVVKDTETSYIYCPKVERGKDESKTE